MWRGICGNDKCLPLWESNNATHQTSWGMCKNLTHGCKPTVLVSDYNTLVVNSTGAAKRATDFSGCKSAATILMRAIAVSLTRKATLADFCGMNLSLWRERTHADAHTKIVQGGGVGEYSPGSVLAKARKLLWDGTAVHQ